MMKEKDMVNDTLSMINNSLTEYASIIAQCSNDQLRQMMQDKRNNHETFQHELAQIAEQKGYYKAAAKVDQNHMNTVKNDLNSVLTK